MENTTGEGFSPEEIKVRKVERIGGFRPKKPLEKKE